MVVQVGVNFGLFARAALVAALASTVSSFCRVTLTRRYASREVSSVAAPPFSFMRASARYLTFKANTEAISQPIPASSFEEALQFFHSDNFQQACLRGTIEPLAPEYRRLWIRACEEQGYDHDYLPKSLHDADGNNRMVRICTTMKFPGLHLQNAVVNGISSSKRGHDKGVMRGVLLAEERTVSGPAARLFDKLMGYATVSATSTISLSKEHDLSVHISSTVTVEIDVPRLLIRIMPLSIDKMQELGSASVQAAVANEVEQGLSCTLDAFEEWKDAATLVTRC